MKATSPRFSVHDAHSLVSECLTLDYFHPNEDSVVPIPAHWRPGQGNLVAILGDNASGKSFFRRIVGCMCREVGTEYIHLSMEGRNNPFGGLRAMVYGDEGGRKHWRQLGTYRRNRHQHMPWPNSQARDLLGRAGSWALRQ